MTKLEASIAAVELMIARLADDQRQLQLLRRHLLDLSQSQRIAPGTVDEQQNAAKASLEWPPPSTTTPEPKTYPIPHDDVRSIPHYRHKEDIPPTPAKCDCNYSLNSEQMTHGNYCELYQNPCEPDCTKTHISPAVAHPDNCFCEVCIGLEEGTRVVEHYPPTEPYPTQVDARPFKFRRY